jgi:hypothetical protein
MQKDFRQTRLSIFWTLFSPFLVPLSLAQAESMTILPEISQPIVEFEVENARFYFTKGLPRSQIAIESKNEFEWEDAVLDSMPETYTVKILQSSRFSRDFPADYTVSIPPGLHIYIRGQDVEVECQNYCFVGVDSPVSAENPLAAVLIYLYPTMFKAFLENSRVRVFGQTDAIFHRDFRTGV